MSKKKKEEPIEQPKKAGRPKAKIDEELLEKLAKRHMSLRSMATLLNVHHDTLHDRYSDKIEFWREQTNGKIADVVFDEAINKRKEYAVKMLAQKHLDYHDKIKTESTNVNINKFELMSDEDLDKKIEELREKQR